MFALSRALFVALVAVAPCFLFQVARAVEKNERVAAELLPPTCLGYAEITQPNRLVELVETHPLRAKIEAIPEYQKAFATPQYKEFETVVAEVEKRLGMKAKDALAKVTAGGLYFAVDTATQGGVLLVRSADEAALVKLRDTLVELVREDATKKGRPDPYETKEYRGFMAYKVNEGVFAVMGPWLVVTNKPNLARLVADRYLDGGEFTLARQERFLAARKTITGQPAAWGFLDVETLRTAASLAKAIPKKHDNPALEFLAGGLISVFEHTPFATAAVFATPERVKLSVAAPFDAAWMSEARGFYFGPSGRGAAPAPLVAKNTLLSLSLYRDVGRIWQHRDELFDDNTVAKMAEADSGLSTLFSGRDFGAEVLGAFDGQWQVVVAQQAFDTQKHVPAVKLPGAAVVLKMKDPEKMQRALKVQFQSLIGFVNIAGAQNKFPQLELENSKQGDIQLVTADFLPLVDQKPAEATGIHFNLSPAMALVGSYCVISSSRPLALELAEKLQARNEKVSPGDGADNLRLSVSAPVLRQLLQDNAGYLVAQNMIEKGHEKDQAEKEVQGLLGLLGWFEGASLRLAPEKNTLRLELEVTAAK